MAGKGSSEVAKRVGLLRARPYSRSEVNKAPKQHRNDTPLATLDCHHISAQSRAFLSPR